MTNIRRAFGQQFGIIEEVTEAAVAMMAEHPAKTSGRVAVIDIKFGFLPADSAFPALRRAQSLDVLHRQAVSVFEINTPAMRFRFGGIGLAPLAVVLRHHCAKAWAAIRASDNPASFLSVREKFTARFRLSAIIAPFVRARQFTSVQEIYALLRQNASTLNRINAPASARWLLSGAERGRAAYMLRAAVASAFPEITV